MERQQGICTGQSMIHVAYLETVWRSSLLSRNHCQVAEEYGEQYLAAAGVVGARSGCWNRPHSWLYSSEADGYITRGIR